jgi:hypothetical protein
MSLKAVIICGDRYWKDARPIFQRLLELPGCIIIEGEAKGADSIARDIALEAGMKVERFPANWLMEGKSAGPIRNGKMLKRLLEFAPDIKVIAFHSDIENSKGTKHMVGIAKAKGVEVEIHT